MPLLAKWIMEAALLSQGPKWPSSYKAYEEEKAVWPNLPLMEASLVEYLDPAAPRGVD